MKVVRELGIFDPRPHGEVAFGGRPGLPVRARWPRDKDTRKPFAFLFSVRGRVLVEIGRGIEIPSDTELSVFAALGQNGFDERLSVGKQSDAKSVATVPSAVVLHRRTQEWRWPPEELGLPIRRARGGFALVQSDAVNAEAPAVSSELDISRIDGPPYWMQDPIAINGCGFALQIKSRIFELLAHRGYVDILGGGTGYLFLSKRPRLGRAGYFFVQRSPR